MPTRRLLATLAVLLCSPAASASGDVWIVDSLGDGDFAQITDAVAVARDGDTILVRPWQATEHGAYDPFTIDDVDLRVVAESGAVVLVEAVRVRNIEASREVVLSGLMVRHESIDPPAGYEIPLHLVDCDGQVRVSRCNFAESAWVAYKGSLTVERCHDVVLEHCDARGKYHGARTAGIAILDSRAALYRCAATGRHEAAWLPEEGAPGLYVSGSDVWLSEGRFEGGVGPDTCTDFTEDGKGGAGVRIEHASIVQAHETELIGGKGGWGGFSLFECHPQAGPEGDPHVVDASSQLLLESSVLPQVRLEPAPLRGGEVELHLRGAPAAELVLRRSSRTVFEPLPGDRGVEHVPQAAGDLGLPLGRLPAGGRRTVTLPLRELTGMMVGAAPLDTLYVQVEATNAPGGSRLGNVVPVTHYTPELLPPPIEGVVHVDRDASPGGDGKTWNTAYRDLQDAAAAVDAVALHYPMRRTEIWIAEGHYTPGDDPSAYFFFRGAALYGGFAGWETELEQRDWETNEVVLSGDLLGDDGADFQNRDDNADHVISLRQADPAKGHDWPFLGPPAILDGFTVEGAEDVAVGAIGSRVRHCRIEDNRSQDIVAGIYASDTALTACVFQRNVSTMHAAALHLENSGQPPWEDFLEENTPPSLQGCRFLGNTGLYGAVSAEVETGRALYVTNNLFQANDGQEAGALRLRLVGVQPYVRLANNTLHANRASLSEHAGGIHADSSALDPEIRVVNSILWENTTEGQVSEDSQVSLMFGSWEVSLAVDHCCVSEHAELPGQGSHGLDPRFVDPLGPDSQPGTGDEDLNLDEGSPCADAASNPAIPPDAGDLDQDGDLDEPTPLDLEGKPRRVDDEVPDRGVGKPPLVDMGALEREE